MALEPKDTTQADVLLGRPRLRYVFSAPVRPVCAVSLHRLSDRNSSSAVALPGGLLLLGLHTGSVRAALTSAARTANALEPGAETAPRDGREHLLLVEDRCAAVALHGRRVVRRHHERVDVSGRHRKAEVVADEGACRARVLVRGARHLVEAALG